MRIGRWVLGLMAVSALSACDPADSVQPDAPSWFRASLLGAVSDNYEGTGEFNAGSDPRTGEALVFTLSSQGLGSTSDQSFLLHRRGGGVPGKGVYALGQPQSSGSSPAGFTAYYVRRVGDRMEAFAAQSGQVEVTSAAPGRLEGTFRFTGLLYCSRAVVGSASEPPTCGSPGTADSKTSIEVSGAFVAVPASNTGSVAR